MNRSLPIAASHGVETVFAVWRGRPANSSTSEPAHITPVPLSSSTTHPPSLSVPLPLPPTPSSIAAVCDGDTLHTTHPWTSAASPHTQSITQSNPRQTIPKTSPTWTSILPPVLLPILLARQTPSPTRPLSSTRESWTHERPLQTPPPSAPRLPATLLLLSNVPLNLNLIHSRWTSRAKTRMQTPLTTMTNRPAYPRHAGNLPRATRLIWPTRIPSSTASEDR